MILQLIILFFFPYLWIRFSKSFSAGKWLSPVVMSYLTGIILANFTIIPIHQEIAKTTGELTILLAIPMLLYATDIKAWLKNAKSTLLSFALCVISGICASIIITFFLKDQIEENWILAGMLVGVYTGGTPNLYAIGLSLGASKESIILMNAADMVCGGIYLIFLTSIAYTIFGRFLPNFKTSENVPLVKGNSPLSVITFRGFLEAMGLTILIAGIAAGICKILGCLDKIAVLLLLLTSFSIFASLFQRVRAIKGAFEIGEYLLLIFCIAIGMQADFGHLLAKGSIYISFTALVLTVTVILHLLVSAFFKIDRDTFMITATAALYGPVFIGQIASVIGNRSLVFAGMVTGLVGYAIGNYLGISVAYFVKWLIF